MGDEARIGLIVLVGNWGGIRGRSRRALMISASEKVNEILFHRFPPFVLSPLRLV
jgi:hypothetical protein